MLFILSLACLLSNLSKLAVIFGRFLVHLLYLLYLFSLYILNRQRKSVIRILGEGRDSLSCVCARVLWYCTNRGRREKIRRQYHRHVSRLGNTYHVIGCSFKVRNSVLLSQENTKNHSCREKTYCTRKSHQNSDCARIVPKEAKLKVRFKRRCSVCVTSC